jgi:hypothetical protein
MPSHNSAECSGCRFTMAILQLAPVTIATWLGLILRPVAPGPMSRMIYLK